MKKIVTLLAAAALLVGSVSAMAEVKLGQVQAAAHGTKCFAVVTAAVDGETIVAAKIDEFQMMDAAAATGVPNGEGMFATQFEAGQVLGSKRVNNALYSTNMASHAGSTKALGASYDAIEAFAAGKTIAELETILGENAETMTDVVSSSTLVDTYGYVNAIVAAAKAANQMTGYYTLYNKTGETVTEVKLTETATGVETVVVSDLAADGVQVVIYTMSADVEAHGALKLSFKTESGYEASFDTLSIETAPITLLAADALTGATAISFFAPAAE